MLILNSCSYFLINKNSTTSNETCIENFNGDWDFIPNSNKPVLEYFFTKNKWKKIKVPSNWYLTGNDFHGTGIYRKKFFISKNKRFNRVIINFRGSDYITEVYLNNKYIGFHEGYFKDFSFDLTKKIKFDKENILIVAVKSEFEPVGDKYWSLNKKMIKGVFNHHDTRPGGAWSLNGQDKNTGGLWSDVYLKYTKDIVLDKYYVSTNRLSENNYNISLNLDINNFSNKNRFMKLVVDIKPFNFNGDANDIKSKEFFIELKSGNNKFNNFIEFIDPKLWWSWDYGKPNLYSFSLKLFDLENNLFDQIPFNYGIRIFERKEDGIFYLNNRKIFLRGVNYISTQWLSEMNEEKYLKDLNMIKESNANSIRVHAHIEDKRFYDLCDDLGMIIWQDFPLQWGYEDSSDFKDSAIKQIREMSDMLFNKSSVSIYSIHNEPPWDAYWMKYKYRNYSSNQNKDLDYVLFDELKKLDNSRYIQMISSTTEHPWYGWYSGTINDYVKKTKSSIISEFGAQALPNLPSLNTIFSNENLWPETDEAKKIWDYHNFQFKETFNIAKVNKGHNIQELIFNTQNYQSKIIKTAAESYRRQKYFPVSAIYQFMFNENWPSVNWGIVDYFREPKQAYFTLKDVFQPILASVDIVKNNDHINLSFWVINDLLDEYNSLNLEYEIRTNNELILKKSLNIDISPSSSEKKFELNLPITLEKMFINVKILDTEGKIISKNQAEFN